MYRPVSNCNILTEKREIAVAVVFFFLFWGQQQVGRFTGDLSTPLSDCVSIDSQFTTLKQPHTLSSSNYKFSTTTINIGGVCVVFNDDMIFP